MYNEAVTNGEKYSEPINTKEPESVKAISDQLMEIVTEELALIREIESFLTGHFDEPSEKERAPQNFAEHLSHIRDYTRDMIPALRRIQEALWK